MVEIVVEVVGWVVIGVAAILIPLSIRNLVGCQREFEQEEVRRHAEELSRKNIKSSGGSAERT